MSAVKEVFSILAARAEEAIPVRDCDYLGEDGLLICGKCHTPKQCRPFPGSDLTVYCLCKCQQEEDRKRQILPSGHMNDRQRLLQLTCLLESPHIIAIDSSERIIHRHTCIAIKAMTPVEPDVECRHDDSNKPQGYRRTVLEPDIDQAEYRCQYVKPMLAEKIHGLEID